MAEHPNLLIIALMGLPASGKSTLCRQITCQIKANENSSDTTALTLSYDDFVPMEVQALHASDNLSAKSLRNKFLDVIGNIVQNIVQGKNFNNFDEEIKSLFNDIETHDAVKSVLMFRNWKILLDLEMYDHHTIKNVVLLIDDNNYYHSMRRELYQIASKYKTGFCVLFPNTSVPDCIKRNSSRDYQLRVPDNVIEEMSKKLEEPDPLQNPCDILSFQVNDVTDNNSYALIQSVIQYALEHPVDVEPISDRREEIEVDRRICSENEIHQADLVLRKWIHTEITVASFAKKKNEIKKFSDELSLKKANVICGLKSGNLSVVSKLNDPIAFQKEIVSLARGVDLK